MGEGVLKFVYFMGLLALFFLTSCGADLYVDTLDIALLNESYDFRLRAEDNSWELFNDSDLVFLQSSGTLPAGVYVAANGTVFGTPTEVGNFEFRVRTYAIDEGFDFDFFDYDSSYDDDVTWDDEWFTLFVTEANTNADCPPPNDKGTTETFICLGMPLAESLAQGEEFTLDVNFFVDFDKANDHAIALLDFTVFYDGSLFVPMANRLNSLSLREAATRTNATVSFDGSAAGELRVQVAGEDKTFHKSGRLMDITFTALADIVPADYEFALIIAQIESENDEASLPATIAIDGLLTVENLPE